MKYLITILLHFSLFGSWLSAEDTVFDLGQKAYNDKAYNFAISRFQVLLKEHPDSLYVPEALYLMGKAYYFLKKDDQANNYFNQFLSRYPLHKRALEIGYFQSKILYNNEQWTACIENCLVFKDKFANEDLGKVEILMALTYLKLNDRERAYSILNNVSGQYKNLAKIELSKIYLMENQLKAASKAISTIYGELNEPLKAEVTYLKGKIAFINRSWFEAKSLFNGYLKTYSKSLKIAEVRFLLAFIPFEQKNYEEAIKSLGSYKLSSTNAFYITQADYFIARSYEESGQIVLALSQYEELVRQGFKSEYYSEALLRLYKVFKTKQNQEKVEYYLNLLANSSQEDIKRFALKEMVLKHLSSDLEESRTFFAKLTPNSKDKIWYIKELLKAEQITEALKHLNAFGSKPEDLLESEWEELIFLKSETLFNNQQYALAQTSFKELMKISSSEKHPGIQERLAYIYFKQGEFEAAIKAYEELLELKDQTLNRIALFMLGELFRVKGDDKAIDYYQQYLATYSNDEKTSLANFRLGRIFYKKKNYNKSLNYFNLVSADSQAYYTKAIYWMGWCQYRLNKLILAEEQFAKIIEVDVNSRYAYEGLLIAGKLGFENKNYKRSTSHYLKVLNNSHFIKDQTQIPQAYFELGQNYLKLGDDKQCEILYHKLLEQYPKYTDIWVDAYILLMEHYYNLKQFEKTLSVIESMPLDSIPAKQKLYIYYLATEVLANLKQTTKKKTYLNKIIDHGVSDYYWDSIYQLANQLDDEGESQQAKIYYKKIKQSGRQDLIALINKKIIKKKESQDLYRVNKSYKLNELLELLKSAKRAETKGLAAYKIAKIYQNQKDQNNALKYLKKTTQYSQGARGKSAQIEIIKIYFRYNDFLNSYNEGMTFFYLYENYNIKNEEILYIISKSAYQIGNINDAKKFNNDLKKKFPQSKYIKDLPNL